MLGSNQFVSIVDACTRETVKNIPVSSPLPVSAVTKKGDALYIAEVAKYRVHRVDTKTDEITFTYTIPDLVAVAIPSNEGDSLWVGTVLGKILTIDTNTGLPVGEPINVPWSAGWLSFTPDGKKLISVHAVPGTVLIIDVESRNVQTSLDMGANSFPEYGAISPDGRYYWVTLGNGEVKVIDLNSNSVRITLNTGSFSFGVKLSPDGSRAFVTTVPHTSNRPIESSAISTLLLLLGLWNPPGEIVTYDTTTFEEINRMPTGNSPTIMSYAGAGG
jgi:DNA-binding beta-propeller fold protein YncE